MFQLSPLMTLNLQPPRTNPLYLFQTSVITPKLTVTPFDANIPLPDDPPQQDNQATD